MPVPQEMNFLVEQASCLFIKGLSRMVQHLSYYSPLSPFSRTGKMPVPQEMNFLVEQASCLFIKGLSRMVQHLS
jgi:hypothetical protein